MKIILFEDIHVTQLYPITLGRVACAITCGSYNLLEVLQCLELPIYMVCRSYLERITHRDYPDIKVGQDVLKEMLAANMEKAPDNRVMLVNARLVPSQTNLNTLRMMLSSVSSSVLWSGNELAAGVVPVSSLLNQLNVDPQLLNGPEPWFRMLSLDRIDSKCALFQYTHDVIRYNMEIFHENIHMRLQDERLHEIRDGVYVASDVILGDYTVTDTTSGPIILDNQVTVGPFCYLRGPVYVGAHTRILEHASIKDSVSLGHTTKVGGEVETSTVEAFSNKQHHGFLGHSYLGSWINLGAGTCNSDLKNTYGLVATDSDMGRLATDMQFLGCVIGDYAKTAINTSIFTGKTIGPCSMVYGFVTRNVPSFVNYARSFGQTTELSVEVMVSTQRRMFARRNVQQYQDDIDLLEHMYELTRCERQLANEPLVL